MNCKFKITLEALIEKFPNLKNIINNFQKFKINNIGFKKELNEDKINNNNINRIICIHKINENNESVQILNKRDDDENKYNNNKCCQLYLSKKKINFCFKYQFHQNDEYGIMVEYKKIIPDMSYIFN